MTLLDMLHQYPAMLPDTLEFTANAADGAADDAVQRACEAAGYTLVASIQGRREYDPVTGVWVQMGLDRMVMQRRAPSDAEEGT